MPSIHYLAGRGDPFELLAALEAGADPNEPGRGGMTPLMHATKAANRVALRLLLKWGADVNAVDARGETAFHHATRLETRRILLDAGADPDRDRLAGMTLLAFFAEFRDREMVDFLLAAGANPDERTRDRRSVREILDDPATAWRSPLPADTSERRASNAKAILKLSEDLGLTPEAYVARHPNIFIWSFGSHAYDDPALAAWASRVRDSRRNLDLLEAACREHLVGDELDDALRSLARLRQRAERERHKERRSAEFEAIHFPESSVWDWGHPG